MNRQYSLTGKQAELLSFLHFHIAETGVAPSFQEMMEGVGLKSKSGVSRLIDALEYRGYIKKLQNRARAIELIAGKVSKVASPVKLATTDALIAELASRGIHIPGSPPTSAGNGRADYLPRVSAPTLPSLHTQAGNDLLNNNTNGNSFNHGAAYAPEGQDNHA